MSELKVNGANESHYPIEDGNKGTVEKKINNSVFEKDNIPAFYGDTITLQSKTSEVMENNNKIIGQLELINIALKVNELKESIETSIKNNHELVEKLNTMNISLRLGQVQEAIEQIDSTQDDISELLREIGLEVLMNELISISNETNEINKMAGGILKILNPSE